MKFPVVGNDWSVAIWTCELVFGKWLHFKMLGNCFRGRGGGEEGGRGGGWVGEDGWLIVINNNNNSNDNEALKVWTLSTTVATLTSVL